MKRIFVLVLAAVALSGCGLFGTKDDPPAQQQVVRQVNDPREAAATAMAACAVAIKDIATGTAGTEASRIVAVGSIERLCGGGGAGGGLLAATLQAPAPQATQGNSGGLGAVLWQATLAVADIALRGYGIKLNRDVAVVQSNNMAATTIASYGAFTSMGGSIERAGVAGYPYVQAPGAVTNNTLSGTGVLGSGTYTGPVTTTTTTTTNRNCNGGSGAGGGAGGTGGPTTPGGNGAAGGSGQGGTC